MGFTVSGWVYGFTVEVLGCVCCFRHRGLSGRLAVGTMAQVCICGCIVAHLPSLYSDMPWSLVA